MFFKGDTELQSVARQKWDSIYGELQRLLRMGAELCLSHGKMTQKDRDKYFVSGELESVFQDSGILIIIIIINQTFQHAP